MKSQMGYLNVVSKRRKISVTFGASNENSFSVSPDILDSTSNDVIVHEYENVTLACQVSLKLNFASADLTNFISFAHLG